MRWSVRIALVGALLLAGAFAIPVVVPDDRDYAYRVVPADEAHSTPLTTVAYGNLTRAERQVFDAARERTDTAPERTDAVRREERVDGTHYRYYYDAVRTVGVEHEGRTYVVHARILRPNYTLRTTGLFAVAFLGVLTEGIAVCAFAVELLGGRLAE